MQVRGIRGAITVDKNEKKAILEATAELLENMVKKNNLNQEAIVAVFFTVTPDLDATFPAAAARGLGWNQVPLLCMTEIPVPNGIPRCIRILLLVNTTKTQGEIRHVYLKGAVALRPDL